MRREADAFARVAGQISDKAVTVVWAGWAEKLGRELTALFFFLCFFSLDEDECPWAMSCKKKKLYDMFSLL